MCARNTRCLSTNLAYAGNQCQQKPGKKHYDTQQEHTQPACMRLLFMYAFYNQYNTRYGCACEDNKYENC